MLAWFAVFEEWVRSDWSYLVIFGVAVLDAFFPVVPSETVAIAGGVLAGSGELNLPLVMLAASCGAFLGDNISYGIGSFLGERTVKRIFRGEKSRKGFAWAERQLEERGAYLVVVARFIPGGRTATTFACGYVPTFSYRRFVKADLVAAAVWGSYTGLLGYWGGRSFEDEPWKGLLVAFAIAVAIAVTVEVVRHRRRKRA